MSINSQELSMAGVERLADVLNKVSESHSSFERSNATAFERIASILDSMAGVLHYHDFNIKNRKLLIEMDKRVMSDCLDFIEEHMSSALHFYEHERILRYALSKIEHDHLFAEFGVFQGNTINFIAKNINRDKRIFGFDSFEGLHEDWLGSDKERGHFSLNGIMPLVDENVVLIKGWFDESLPKFLKENSDYFSFVHIDSDTYEAAAAVLTNIAGRLLNGTVIVFDEYFGYRGWRSGEHRAWSEFVELHNIKFEYIAFCAMQVVVRIVDTGSLKHKDSSVRDELLKEEPVELELSRVKRDLVRAQEEIRLGREEVERAKREAEFVRRMYSQWGEDCLIEHLFPSVSNGRYLDIGCYHPFRLSNTAQLYLRGWRGVNVDPNPFMIEKFKQMRPDDVNLNCAVSGVNGSSDFYFGDVWDSTNTLSLDTAIANAKSKGGDVPKPINVETITMSSIFENYFMNGLPHVVTIDAEGCDFDVLNSNNWDVFRPPLVIAEDGDFLFHRPMESKIYEFMIAKNYTMYSRCLTSSFFVRNEDFSAVRHGGPLEYVCR